jgi:hypothetical protein
MQLSEATSLFGSVSYDVTLDGRSHAWDVKVGFKVRW